MALGESGFRDWKSIYRNLGLAEKIFAILVLLWAAVSLAAPASALRPLLLILGYLAGVAVALKFARRGIARLIWKLSNRLYVVYMFIAVVPICLIGLLAVISAYIFTSQVALYLVTAELDRRTTSLHNMTEWLVTASETKRDETIKEMAEFSAKRFPGLQLLIRDREEVRFPEDADIDSPPKGWNSISGIVNRNGLYCVWAHSESETREVTALVPLTFDFISDLVPHLGEVSYLPPSGQKERTPRLHDALPPPANRFDIEMQWFAVVPAAVWNTPPQMQDLPLQIRTRFSAVYRTMTAQQSDSTANTAAIAFVALSILFLLVELVALIIGVSLTRTITGAVHNLYDGTLRIRVGNFAHRIEVKGDDQLAELGLSFNRMTEDLEKLVAVAKEKERMQAELELASEVQAQLYPKTLPQLKTLRLIAGCSPARMVSGDYFDYQTLLDHKLAIALGDVAGKGISAALLMATVGSSLRTQLRNCLEGAMGSRDGTPIEIATSDLVSQLNKHIYKDTAPEKYLTFYFGIYDDESGVLTYTNAGHLPPIVIRRGLPIRLDVNGTVVGAFPFAVYDESKIQLESGDLLVCYTDGITEPENDYGEMFGDERLIDVLIMNSDRDEQQMVDAVMNAVRQWTGSPELQDDMTMLLARRL
jgi:sigma-B regulation protein RsbU (phosphoserine phosphatase)